MKTILSYLNSFLIIIVLLFSIETKGQLQSTTAPKLHFVNNTEGRSSAVVSDQDFFYIGENIINQYNVRTGARINKISKETGDFIESLVDSVYSKNTTDPAGFFDQFYKTMAIVNNKLFYYHYVGGNERAIVMVDKNTKDFDFSKRISFEEASLVSLVSYNNYLYIFASYGSDYKFGRGGNYSETYSGSGNAETSIYRVDTDLNIVTLAHISDTIDSFSLVPNGVSVRDNRFLLSFDDGGFLELDTNGQVIHSIPTYSTIFEGATRIKKGHLGNYILLEKNKAKVLDSNWQIKDSIGRISYGDIHDVSVIDNGYVFLVGKQNLISENAYTKQIYAYYYYDEELNFKYKISGVALERYLEVNPYVYNFETLDVTSDGYWRIGYYTETPERYLEHNSYPLYLGGESLPVASTLSPKIVSYYNNTSPSDTLKIDLKSEAIKLHLNKKINNEGSIVDANMYSTVVVVANHVNLESLVGFQTPSSLLEYHSPTGYTVWDNIFDENNYNVNYNKGNIQKKNGKYFVNISIVDYQNFPQDITYEALITCEINMKIYLINESSIQLDDDNDGVINTNDNCPNTPSGTVVDENGCTDTSLGLDDYNTETIKVYPNPTTDYITISGLDTSKVEVFLTNVMGTSSYLGTHDAYRDVKISLNRFPVGFYVLTLVSSETGNKKDFKILKN